MNGSQRCLSRAGLLPIVVVFLGLLASPGLAQYAATPLDDYVGTKEANPDYAVVGTTQTYGCTVYELNLHSQTWRDPSEVDPTDWYHQMFVYIPDGDPAQLKDTAMLWAGAGIRDGWPQTPSPYDAQLAVDSTSVVATVFAIPDNPVTFYPENETLIEDPLLARTFRRHLDSAPGDETWPALLPMVKGVARAMDTIEHLGGAEPDWDVNDFVISGHSKRGWTTWLTGAYEVKRADDAGEASRIAAIIPSCFEALNLGDQMAHQRASLLELPGEDSDLLMHGGYSSPLTPYVDEGIIQDLASARGQDLLASIDPYSYLDRLAEVPKAIAAGGQDQFFMTDSGQHYMNDLEGETHVMYRRDIGHSGVATRQLAEKYYKVLLSGVGLPEYDWIVQEDGSIRVTIADGDPLPDDVKLWAATKDNRDFRDTGFNDVTWVSQDLTLQDPGGDEHYLGMPVVPGTGAIAYLVEMTYGDLGGESITFATEIVVTRKGDYSNPAGLRPDGLITDADVDYWRDHVFTGDPQFDLTTTGAASGDPDYGLPDGVIDLDDMYYLIEAFVFWDDGTDDGRGQGTIVGDVNLDGVVDIADLSTMRTTFGQTDIGYAGGNLNADTIVDIADLTILRSTIGQSAQMVPEPGLIWLLVASVSAVLRKRAAPR